MVENLTDAGPGDVVASCVVEYCAGNSGLVVRYSDADNYLLLQFNGSFGRMALLRREAGAWFPLVAVLTPIGYGDRIAFRAAAATLEAYKNGERLLRADDGFQRLAALCGTYRAAAPDDVLSGFAVVPATDVPPPPVAVKLGSVSAYYPDDLRYFDPEF